MEVVVSHRRRVGGVALAFAAVAAFAAGCGGGSKDGDTSAAAPAASDYFTCLQNNGVNIQPNNGSGRPSGFPSGRPSGFPRPTDRPSGEASRFPGGGGFPGGGFLGSNPPSGVSQEAWDKARKACASLQPSFGGNRSRNPNGANAAYRNCLTDHGVTASGPIDTLSTADPKVAAAIKACAPLAPNANPTPAPSAS
jgi:hypothetical protein